MRALPDWIADLSRLPVDTSADQLSRFLPPEGHRRRSAVLILFSGADDGRGPGEVLLTERAATLRAHAGQVSFPGGRLDPGDRGPEDAALREAVEETGLDPTGVQVVGTLPPVFLPVSDYAVTPVLAWWCRPSRVRVVDPGEVARVVRAPVAELVDPANRCMVRHPSGHVGPAFEVAGLLVWGFTAGLLDRVLHLAGWDREWDRGRTRELT